MDKTLYDQIINLLEKSQKILVLAHAKVDCDGLGAALAAYLVFKELGKEVTVATNDPAPENLAFLPAIDIVKNSLAGTKDFIITLDASKSAIGKIKYNVENNKVNIIITPKDGSFSESDVSFRQGLNKFDLIFVLDSGNLEHLGPLYEQNVEMFYETPVINMDHHASNTDFGNINIVDVTASSTTEIFYEFLDYLEKKYNKKLVTEDIATLLLAGIITDTGSFQHANTSPRAMETAAKLLDLGARQQEVIKNIYKTKKLSTLKLWGIILSKVQVDPVHRMVWSVISKDDLQEAEADPNETEGIIDDLLTNAPGAEVIFLIKQSPDYVSVSMRSTNNQTDVGKFCADNGGGGHVRAAGFKIRDKRPFDEVVNDVISKVRKFQADRLNIHEPIVAPIVAPVVAPMVEKPTTIEPQSAATSLASDRGEAGSHEAKRVATTVPQQESKVTYLDFKAPKPAFESKPEPEKKPAPPTAETKPAPDKQPVQTVSEVRKPDVVNQPAAPKRKRHRNRHKKYPVGENQPMNQPKPPTQAPHPKLATEQPKKQTPPPAPYVEPV